MEGKRPKILKYDKLIEAVTWVIVIIILFGVRFLPKKLIPDDQTYYFIGGIVAFALFYYLVVYKFFQRTQRFYLKIVADVVLIGILIHVLKDYGQYFFALYFLPIAAAALSLEFINALLIAVVAAVFVVFEIFLGSQNLYPESNQLYQGAWQIGLILLITIFCRMLSMQLKQEREEKEESLAREKMLKEESDRNKDFLSLTSHQLFTPLSMIRGFSAMLTDENYGKLSTKQSDAAKEIYTNTTRMVDLVTELLSISRIQAGAFQLKKAQTDIGELIKDVVDQFNKVKNKKDVQLIYDVDHTDEINIDKEKIRNCLYNLVDNAIKYTKEGTIKVTVIQDQEKTTIKISDEGPGIKDEDFNKLFQPFFRGKNILELDNTGTGLGLYISRLIIEKHGGKIWAANNETKGSTFTFYLPN